MSGSHDEQIDGSRQTGVVVRVFLLVLECDPEMVTRTLDITPLRTARKGEQCWSDTGKPRGRALADYWRINSPTFLKGSLDEQIDSLIDMLTPYIDRFASLPPEREVMLECLLSGYTERPSVFFTERQINFLARIGASVDVDVYDYSGIED